MRRTRLRLAELDQQLSVLEAQVPQGETRTPNTELIRTSKEIESLTGFIAGKEKERDKLMSEVEDTESLKRNFFAKRSEYQQINRNLDEAASQLRRYKDELRESDIAMEIEKSQRGINLRVDEYAEEPNRPSKPKIEVVLGAALILGGGLGGLLVILTELLDNSLGSIDQAVDDLKLPVLGAVNEIVSPSDVLRYKIFGRGVYPVLAAVMTISLLISVYLAEKSLSDPVGYEKMVGNPRQYLERTFFGR